VRPLTDDFTPVEIDRARRRKRDLLPLLLITTFLGLAVSPAVGLTPFGAGVVRVAGDLAGGGWVARAVLGSLALSLLGLLVGLPFSVWDEIVDRRWGLSLRTWRLFAADRAKGFAIGALLTAAAVFGLYAAMRSLAWW
jgi:STE24 endopeptidase